MQRFVRIGGANVQVLSAMMHDARGTERVTSSLTGLHPEAIIVDRSIAEWTSSSLDPLQKIIVDAIPDLRPGALWQGVAQVASRLHAEVVVLHESVPAYPRAGIARLRKLVKKEGFDATGDPGQDLVNFHRYYVARVPEVWQVLEDRRDRCAARLRAMFETRPRRAAVVLASPDGDIVCDRIQALGK